MITNSAMDNSFFPIIWLRAYVAIACFIMWIKVFYWMRLFSSTAYYVKLITQTLDDVMLFLLLCLIILFAFANFFYMLNIGTDSNNAALPVYTGLRIPDAIIAIFQFALGQFATDGFINSDYDILLWISFNVCVFLMIVVFMNMIIAIMGNTFANVMEAKKENALDEIISLIYDHIWLLDFKEEFRGVKYIIRVAPDAVLSNEVEDV